MDFAIKVKKRQPGNPEQDRALGLVPAVVYGPEIEPISISMEYQDFLKLYETAGESSLIDCQVEGEKEPIVVLIQDVQHDPVKGKITHVDFRQIKMGEEIETAIAFEFVGESDAVKNEGGTLIQSLESVNVKCLPKNLVSHIDVNLDELRTFDDIIHIEDLIVPAGITLLDDPKTVVAKVNPPLTEEQIKAMEEEGTKGVEEVEVEAGAEDEEESQEAEVKEAGEKPKEDVTEAAKEATEDN